MRLDNHALTILLKLHLDLTRRDEALEMIVDVFQDRQTALAATNLVEVEKYVRIDED